MAFHWQTFRTRALSAVVFVIIMLAGLLWNAWSFLALFTLIHFGAWIEYQRLVEKIDPKYAGISPIHRYGVMLAGWGFILWMTNDAWRNEWIDLSAVGFWMMVVGGIAVNLETLLKRSGKLIAHSLMGWLYISLSLGLLVGMYDRVLSLSSGSLLLPAGTLPIIIICCMWVNDTMAYIVGSLFGKTPLSPISPKKTWEGTIGGAVLCIAVVGYVVSAFVLQDIASAATIHWYIIAGIAAAFGTLGDLFESKLKRLAGVKDSGAMMPGHGGFLDRFDSLLLATTFVWVYLWAIQMLA